MIAINLDDDEDLIGVELTDGNSEIILATRNGIAIRFDEQDVRTMGRTAHGVKGISLNYGDEVVAMDSVSDEDSEVLTATEFGMGKRTEVKEYRKQTRGGKGIINMKITEKTGLVIGMKVINPDQEIMMITAAGLIIRLVAVRANKENEQTLNILGAGALAGAAIYSFFTATLGLVGKKD